MRFMGHVQVAAQIDALVAERDTVLSEMARLTGRSLDGLLGGPQGSARLAADSADRPACGSPMRGDPAARAGPLAGDQHPAGAVPSPAGAQTGGPSEARAAEGTARQPHSRADDVKPLDTGVDGNDAGERGVGDGADAVVRYRA